MSSLRWEWRRTRATVRVNAEITPPVPEIIGGTLYMVGPHRIPRRETTDCTLSMFKRASATLPSMWATPLRLLAGLAYDLTNMIIYGATSNDSLQRINLRLGVAAPLMIFLHFPSTKN